MLETRNEIHEQYKAEQVTTMPHGPRNGQLEIKPLTERPLINVDTVKGGLQHRRVWHRWTRKPKFFELPILRAVWQGFPKKKEGTSWSQERNSRLSKECFVWNVRWDMFDICPTSLIERSYYECPRMENETELQIIVLRNPGDCIHRLGYVSHVSTKYRDITTRVWTWLLI